MGGHRRLLFGLGCLRGSLAGNLAQRPRLLAQHLHLKLDEFAM
jgi:hypothetical protein